MLVDEMKTVLANTFLFYYKAHAAHWNVEGMLFSSLHDFFGALYTDLHGSIDPIAEHMRALGVYAPFSLVNLAKSSEVTEDSSVYESREMIQSLIDANDLVRKSLYRARREADAVVQSGVINFLEERIDKHDKWAWQLLSHLQ